MIVKSVLLEIGINCHLIPNPTVGEVAMFHLGLSRKVACTSHGATVPVFSSQDAEDLTKATLTFTLVYLRLCPRPFHKAGKDTAMQMMLICTFVFHTKDAEPSIHTSKQEHHKVSNASQYQVEMIRLSNVLLGLDWWGVQQQANLSTAADTL